MWDGKIGSFELEQKYHVLGVLNEVAFYKSSSVVLCISHGTFIYSTFLLRNNSAKARYWVRVDSTIRRMHGPCLSGGSN